MALLDEVGGLLSAAGVASSSGAGGYLLFLSRMPDSSSLPDRALALIEYGGRGPNPRTDLDYPSFQVMVRGPSLMQVSSAYGDARSKAEAAKLALHAYHGTASGRYYVGILAQQDPFLMHYDERQRPVIVCNFSAQRSRT